MAVLAGVIKPLIPNIVIDAIFAIRRHKSVHGVIPNILWPRSFNEKILRRNLFSRNPLLEIFADKLAVRSYVESKLGKEVLPDLYWSTARPADIPFDKLPSAFVAKPTHGSGWVKLVRDRSSVQKSELVKICEDWLKRSLYKTTHERIYRNIKPAILIEEFIGASTGRVPNDYKFYVFGGRVEMVEILTGRFSELHSNLFDRAWNRLEVEFSAIPPLPVEISPPKHLAKMIEIAELLAKDFDFLRVDLYDTGEKVYFGEITVSPGAGLDKFKPPSYDLYLGALWKKNRNGNRIAAS